MYTCFIIMESSVCLWTGITLRQFFHHFRLPTVQHQQMPRGHQNVTLPNVCQTHLGICVDGMRSVHREEHQICVECAASSFVKSDYRWHSRLCDHHDRKSELGHPCDVKHQDHWCEWPEGRGFSDIFLRCCEPFIGPSGLDSLHICLYMCMICPCLK